DPRLQNSKLPHDADDTSSRLVNLDFILRSIRSFVQDVLRYLIVTKLPNIYMIAKEPYAEYSFNEIERILLLLLACSISGDSKEVHIRRLQTLDEPVQQSLMPYLQEFTDDINSTIQPSTPKDESLKILFLNIEKLVQERDILYEDILELEQDKDLLKQKLEQYQSGSNLIQGGEKGEKNMSGGGGLHSTPSQTSLNTFLNDLEAKHPEIEISEYKQKMRQMKLDIDDKIDIIDTIRDELDSCRLEVNRLKNDNMELSQQSKLTRLYRDEIDSLREKVSKIEKCEQELSRCREKLDEFDHLKLKIDELQQENHLLSDSRQYLEQQIESYQIRVQELLQVELNLSRFKRDIELITNERDLIRDKLEYLLEDKLRLEFDLNSTTTQMNSLNNELKYAREDSTMTDQQSLSFTVQCQQTIKQRILKYELHTKHLEIELSQYKEKADIKQIEYEKQQIHLSLLQEQLVEYKQNIEQIEMKYDHICKEKIHLEQKQQADELQYQKYVCELQTENKHLKLTMEKMKQREQMEQTTKIHDIELENKRLQDKIIDIMQQYSQLEIEHNQLVLIRDRECTLNERIISLQLKHDQTARDLLDSDKRRQLLEYSLKHYETIEHDYLELKHSHECLLRQQQEHTTLEQDHLELKLKCEQYMIQLEKSTQTNLQLEKIKAEHLKLQQHNRELEQEKKKLERYSDDKRKEYEQLELNKQREWDQMTQKLLNNELTIEKLRQDLHDELVQREDLQTKVDSLQLQQKVPVTLQEVTDDSSINNIDQKASNITIIDVRPKSDENMNDYFMEIERKNVVLKSDNVHLHVQLRQYESIQRSLKETVETISRHLSDIQSDKQRLQLELSSYQQRIEQLQLDLDKQRKLVETVDNDRSSTLQSCHHLQQTYDQLAYDHDQLQKLYTKLEYELDTTINQLYEQKTTNRILTKECKYLQNELNNISKERNDSSNRVQQLLAQLHTLEAKLAEQKPFDEHYITLQRQFQTRNSEYQECLTSNQLLKQQLDDMKLDLSKTRSELACIQMKYTNINALYLQLISKYEFLELHSDRTEEEKSQLIDQLHSLVQQNQNVLAQALSNKDLFHEEARGYLEQLHHLMRQKELLEMKIMEQYKNMSKPRRSRGLIQSVSRKTRNILDRLANRRSRTSSADCHLYESTTAIGRNGDCDSRASPSTSSIENNSQHQQPQHARSTTPDVISSSLPSARYHHHLFTPEYGNDVTPPAHCHQSTDSLVDSSSKDESPSVPIEENVSTSYTPMRLMPPKTTDYIVANENGGPRQSPFRPIRDSPGIQRAVYDYSPSNQRRCSSTQSLNLSQNGSSLRRGHRTPITTTTFLAQQQQQSSPLKLTATDPPSSIIEKDLVLITEFGAI
ncbi:unnamed protein product, partial [Didymodactylos carnosus]